MTAYLNVPRRWSSYAVFATTSESDIDRALMNALEWCYDGIQFDFTKAGSPNRALVVRELLAAHVLEQTNAAILIRVAASEAQDFITLDSQEALHWNIVLHLPMEDVLIAAVGNLIQKSEKRAVTIRILAGADLETTLASFKKLSETGVKSVHVEFPFSVSTTWREEDIVAWIQQIESEAGLTLLPPIGWGLEDPDLSAEDQVLPNPEIVLRQNEETSPKLSVIIPTFEKTVELTNTVRHLLRQRMPYEDFELIVVDCGSFDTTLRDVEKLIASEGRTTSTTIIKIARPIRKRRGESRYRAGLARNVGAAKARGQFLLFLDDDVLLPNDYLGRLMAALEVSPETVFVGRCHNLKAENFGVRMSYEKFDCARDTESPDRGFWRDFYERQSEWMKFERPWRFLSTHTLALSRELFVRTGWFRENFISYGFEDMELGFRLSKLGASFQILPVDVFRQTRARLPESKKVRRAKHEILSRAAQVFYRHTLNQEVFTQVHRLFRRPLWFWLWYDKVRTGGPLWRLRRREF
jgi:glycosyltransferase involved in cell wall biosynthesis